MAKTLPVRLVAVGPGKHVYGTRALVAGDEFEMSREWAEILIRLGKARLVDEKPAPGAEAVQMEKAAAKVGTVVPSPAVAEPPPPSSSLPPETDHGMIDRLRDEAAALGIEVDGRWGVVRLRHEIEQAK